MKLQAEWAKRTRKLRPTLSMVLTKVFKDKLKVLVFWGNSDHVGDNSRNTLTIST
jgi:hypothetical protein